MFPQSLPFSDTCPPVCRQHTVSMRSNCQGRLSRSHALATRGGSSACHHQSITCSSSRLCAHLELLATASFAIAVGCTVSGLPSCIRLSSRTRSQGSAPSPPRSSPTPTRCVGSPRRFLPLRLTLSMASRRWVSALFAALQSCALLVLACFDSAVGVRL